MNESIMWRYAGIQFEAVASIDRSDGVRMEGRCRIENEEIGVGKE